MNKLQELFDPEDLDNNTFEDELEQYDSEPIDNDSHFDELMSDVDYSDHNFEEIFANNLQTYDSATGDSEPIEPDLYDYDWLDDSELELYHERLKNKYNLKRRLAEGGPRKNMSQETIDKFIHELLLVPDSARRQEIVNMIFEKIKEENQKAYERSQKKLAKTETQVQNEM
jgi:hypothetical protein